jgi:hypothetical protein
MRDTRGHVPGGICPVTFDGQHAWLRPSFDGAVVCFHCKRQVNLPPKNLSPGFSTGHSRNIFRKFWNWIVG